MAPLLSSGDPTASQRSTDGAVVDSTPHAVTAVATAAAVAATGDRARSNELLNRAASIDRSHPTYYGSAWVALGRILLTSSALGGCQP
jgi:endoglucanase